MENLEKIIKESEIEDKQKDLLLKIINNKEELKNNSWLIIIVLITLFCNSKMKEDDENV